MSNAKNKSKSSNNNHKNQRNAKILKNKTNLENTNQNINNNVQSSSGNRKNLLEILLVERLTRFNKIFRATFYFFWKSKSDDFDSE